MKQSVIRAPVSAWQEITSHVGSNKRGISKHCH